MEQQQRSVLLLGSVPLETPTDVFEAVGSKLGPVVKRMPDGEIGARKDWIVWQADVVKRANGLEPGSAREMQGGYKFTLYRAKPNSIVEFGPLGYAAAAIDSYQEFRRAKESGKIPPGTRYQISLPTPLAVVLAYCEPASIEATWLPYERRLGEEIEEIAAVIPHDELAFQWDIAAEICFILENPEMAKAFPVAHMDSIVASIGRTSEHIPARAELGLHLCYGDPGHKHLVEPKDTSLMVDLSNRLFVGIKHPIAWIHMPVPRDRDDVAYFAPLKQLKIPRGTELYLGLVHLTDGIAGARRRLDAAKNVVADFGIATECGFGRRPPETIPALLDLHRDVALAG